MTDVLVERVRELFASWYGSAPAVVVRVPGRVNLIGEHTDYSLLPAMPLAINRGIVVAVGPGPRGEVRAVSEQFEGAVCLTPRDLATTPPAGWQRYLWAVLRVLWREAGERGATIAIDSDLPSTGGLSSSAALVTGLVAGLSDLWGVPYDRDTLVARAIAAEHQAGVETGGLDQNAILFGQAGHALRLDFAPPRRTLVPIPDTLRIVVAYSGEPAAKGAEARDAYNQRVVGCRMAAALLAQRSGVRAGVPPVLGAVVAYADQLASLPAEARAIDMAREVNADPMMLAGLTTGRLDDRLPLPVRAYARHVLGEAARVDAAEAALRAGDLPALGRLLDASHESLRADYGCSTQALDALCEAMRGAGAFGARLTGAGFGGHALAVAAPEAVDAVIGAAVRAAGGPGEEVVASDGLAVLR